MASGVPTERIAIHVVPPERYFGDRPGWDTLVRRSCADPLFMGHAWQSEWWSAFGARHGLTPCFLEFGRDGFVVGRASLFRRRIKVRGLAFESLEVLGNLWRGPATFRSEFLDVLVAPDEADTVAAALRRWLRQDSSWDLLTAVDLAADGVLARALEGESAFDGMRSRESEGTSFEVPIEGTLHEYRAALSQNARRKMFGQRRKLQEALGPLMLRETGDFDELERLHTLRWGSPLLHGGRHEFLTGLQKALPPGGLHVSLLQAGPQPVSALLNACVDGWRLYNLQGGFDADACGSISPARIHWGLLIEDAFRSGDVAVIDLLLGRGRAADHKREMAARGRGALSIQIIRRAVLRAAKRMLSFLERVPSSADQ